jgi:endoglucanase
MNEPHDIPALSKWVNTTSEAVKAIRKAGAVNQMILLPGTDFTSATTFATKSGPLLLAVSNPDGTKNGLVFNVHRYLDQDGSGTNAQCVTNNIDESFQPLADFLRQNNRTAMLTETGGGPNDLGCMTMLCQQNDFLK